VCRTGFRTLLFRLVQAVGSAPPPPPHSSVPPPPPPPPRPPHPARPCSSCPPPPPHPPPPTPPPPWPPPAGPSPAPRPVPHPARHTTRTDAEAVAAVAEVAKRFLDRGTVARSGTRSTLVTPARIAVGAAHRDQVAALRAALSDLPDLTVDTANRLQGREYDIT